MKNEDLYQYQFESMLLQAKDIFGRSALFYSDDEDENEIETESKAEKPLFDVSGLYFSRFKALESEYRYWVEIYIMKIIEKLLERSNHQYEEKYFGTLGSLRTFVFSAEAKLAISNKIDSSFYLEVTATEFEVQGLEIDYGIVAWDGDVRYENGEFIYKRFSRSMWCNVNKEERRRYMKNAYIYQKTG